MKKYLALIILALTFVCLLAFSTSAETFVNPVANGADPFVLKEGDTYFMYATSGGSYGYRLYTSKNLVEWEAQGYCLRRSDVFTDDSIVSDSGSKVYNFWAPEVFKYGDTYVMAYTAQEHLGIATSDSPYGPFKNDATSYLDVKLTQDDGSLSKAIDGHFFQDDDGTIYFYFVSCGVANGVNDSIDHGNNIWGVEFDMDTLSFVGDPVLVIEHDNKNEIKYDRWINTGSFSWLYPHRYDGSAVSEGPEMLKHDGKYYLTFSQDGYSSSQYSIFYATASSPLGSYGDKELAFITADQLREDTSNPHLYGVGHHSFTTSPDGSELIIVYHAHRSATDPNGVGNYHEERRVCIDLAWFDESGNFCAGRANEGYPTATAQVLPSGGTLQREQHLEGSFADLPSLPTIYVAYTDGNDSGAGTKADPFKTITAACNALTNGGTIILTQTYAATSETSSDYCSIPAVNGPLMIKGDFSAVPFRFKFMEINSDVYFDDVCFWPETANYYSVIACNFNNVVMGEGVSCIAQPTRVTFPILAGGNWVTSEKSGGAYDNFVFTSNADITSSEEFTLKVLSGTWSIVSKYSIKNASAITSSAPGGTLIREGDTKIRPATASAPTVTATGEGAVLSIKDLAYTEKFAIYKNGTLIGYADTNEYLDTTWRLDANTTYAIAGYVNGCCYGNTSSKTALSFVADVDSDGDIDVADAVTLLKNIVNDSTNTPVRNVIIILKQLVRA